MTGIVHESAPADNHLFSTFLDLGTLEVVPTIPVDRAPRVDRTARGLALFRSGAVRRVGPARYAVTGSSGTTYMLRAEPGTKRARLTCTCADFVLRQRDLGKACAHISAVSAYFAAKMTKDRPEPEPPPAPARVLPYRPRLALVDTECVTIEAVDPFAHNQVGVDFQPGMRAIARLRGADVEVELGARNPRTKYGAGFWARRLDTGRTVTILSPGCLRVLRPVPSPARAAPNSVRATVRGDVRDRRRRARAVRDRACRHPEAHRARDRGGGRGWLGAHRQRLPRARVVRTHRVPGRSRDRERARDPSNPAPGSEGRRAPGRAPVSGDHVPHPWRSLTALSGPRAAHGSRSSRWLESDSSHATIALSGIRQWLPILYPLSRFSLRSFQTVCSLSFSSRAASSGV
jgi:hypothetical protein